MSSDKVSLLWALLYNGLGTERQRSENDLELTAYPVI